MLCCAKERLCDMRRKVGAPVKKKNRNRKERWCDVREKPKNRANLISHLINSHLISHLILAQEFLNYSVKIHALRY